VCLLVSTGGFFVKNIFKISAFAALLFCAAAVYAQSNDYKACRCRQWNGSNLSTLGVTLNDCCSLKQSGYSVGSYFSGSGTTVGSQSGANVTCGAVAGTITLTSRTIKMYTSHGILDYAPDSSVCNQYCDSSYITTTKNDSTLGIVICGSNNYGTGSSCDKATFQSCYYDGSFSPNASAGGGPQVNTCIVPGHATYGNCQNAFVCEGGCTQSGNVWTCYNNLHGVTFSQALATGTKPVNCYAYQCLCAVSATYVECK